MKDEKSQPNLCVHILPGKSHVLTGAKSTLRMYKRMQHIDVMLCDTCSKELALPRHDGLLRIESNSASGQRAAHAERYAKDLVQPYDRYGKENRKFTEAYGWNPYAPDPKLHRQPHERAGGDSGKASD